MKEKRRIHTQNGSIPVSLLAGAFGSLSATLVFSAIGGKILDSGAVKQESLGYLAMAVLFLAAMTGSVIAMKIARKSKLLVSALSAASYYLVLLAITALFFDGQYQALGVTALLILAGALAPALLSGMENGKLKHKNIKKAYR